MEFLDNNIDSDSLNDPATAMEGNSDSPNQEENESNGLDDSTSSEEDLETRQQRFLKWLTENGALFPKIQWPSLDTVGGVRGAVALDDIESGEQMVIIPEHLMMCPPQFMQSDTLGPILSEHREFLHTDMALSLYVMQEMIKGEESFYWPFLNILPDPLNATDWTETELAELQDNKIISRAQFRRDNLKKYYERNFRRLFTEYPESIKAETHTWKLFKKAWGTIQARAFGRRLPWTALVPFADCLNHSNVQTRYDYNQDGNKLFRLFPCGKNHYPRGSEVFNSYGRRSNENLLMEYGFAIKYNEWDSLVVTMHLSPDDDDYTDKRMLMLNLGSPSSRSFHLTTKELSEDALSFCRLVCLHGEELNQFPKDLTRDHFKSFRVSQQNEISALALLRESILRKSSDFLTTLEEDETILSEVPTHEERKINAIYYRMTKKKIIQCQSQLLDKAIELVEGIEWGSSNLLLSDGLQVQDAILIKYLNGLSNYFASISSTKDQSFHITAEESGPAKIVL